MPNIMNIALPDSGFSFKRISYFRIEGIINNSKSKRQREREREREREMQNRGFVFDSQPLLWI